MASNPMQKKSRNSFLLGMLLMLIIAAIAMVVLVMVMTKNNKKVEKEERQQASVYVVKNTIMSGQEVTEDDLEIRVAYSDTIPKDAYGEVNSLYSEVKNDKGEIELKPKYRAKMQIEAGAILSTNMMYEGEELHHSERIQEYNVLQLPVHLDVGEYVDVRFQLSNGQDYIVIAHKEVKDISKDTIWLQVDESEILLMSGAMVESYISPATRLYVTKYVEPGMQGATEATYTPSITVMSMIDKDPNIVSTARDELVSRYNENRDGLRTDIQNELNKVEPEQVLENIQQQMQEAVEKAKEERELYLNGVQ